jgi:hypothetical protein
MGEVTLLRLCKFCGNQIGNEKESACVFCNAVYQFIKQNPETTKKMIEEIKNAEKPNK